MAQRDAAAAAAEGGGGHAPEGMDPESEAALLSGEDGPPGGQHHAGPWTCPRCGKALKARCGLTSHLNHCDPAKAAAEAARDPQERALKINVKRREGWEQKYADLCEFKRLNRHCRVPSNAKCPEFPGLGSWVSAQRREYKKRRMGLKSQLTDERVLKLVQIGFEWGIHETNWDVRYRDLLEFKRKFGHVDVPITYKANPHLSVWVARQRGAYKNRGLGKRSGMTDERVKALEQVGFKWTLGRVLPDTRASRFDDRIDQLKAYKEEHGHTNVPRNYKENMGLASWVEYQRYCHRHGEAALTEERKGKLEELGFEWDAPIEIKAAKRMEKQKFKEEKERERAERKAARESLKRQKEEERRAREAEREKAKQKKEEDKKAREEARKRREEEKELIKLRKKRKAEMMGKGTPSPLLLKKKKKSVKPPKSKEEALRLLQAKKEEKEREKAEREERARKMAMALGHPNPHMAPVGPMMVPVPMAMVRPMPMHMPMQVPAQAAPRSRRRSPRKKSTAETDKKETDKEEAGKAEEEAGDAAEAAPARKTKASKAGGGRKVRTTLIPNEAQEAMQGPTETGSAAAAPPPLGVSPPIMTPGGPRAIPGAPAMFWPPGGVTPNQLFAPVPAPPPQAETPAPEKKAKGNRGRKPKKGVNAVNPRKEREQKREEAARKAAEEAQRAERQKAAAAAAAYYAQMAAAWKEVADREAGENGKKGTKRRRKKRGAGKKAAKAEGEGDKEGGKKPEVNAEGGEVIGAKLEVAGDEKLAGEADASGAGTVGAKVESLENGEAKADADEGGEEKCIKGEDAAGDENMLAEVDDDNEASAAEALQEDEHKDVVM